MNFLATYTEDRKEYYGTVNININDVITTANQEKNIILKDNATGIILNDLLGENVEPGKTFTLWIYPNNNVFINKSNTDIKHVKPFNISASEIEALTAFSDVIHKYNQD